jgi:23S rRNA (pseudouridine1915-N3)-methyltransferase
VKVFLYYVGKTKDAHANALAAEYIKRTSHYASAQMAELKPGRTEFWTKHPTATKILLDPAGKQLDSNAFANLFAKGEMLGHDLVFVIGGHDGLPEEWKSHADILLSLSPMTMPHELARAVVAEQIYRAFTILRNHPYPR